MQRNPSSRTAARIANIFWTTQPLLPREEKELAKYGAPAAVPTSAPARAGYGEFNELGFAFKEEGARALLFLLTNKHGEATDILAWAPQLGRLSSCYPTTLVREEDEAESSESGTCPHGGRVEVL